MKCYDLLTSNVLWTSPINRYTYISTLDDHDYIYISTFNSRRKVEIKDVFSGKTIKKIEADRVATHAGRILLLTVEGKLTIFDQVMQLVSDVSKPLLGVRCFAHDGDGNFIVCGLSVTISSFRKDGTLIAELFWEDIIDLIDDVVWSASEKCVIAIVACFRSVNGVYLVRFESSLREYTVIRPLPPLGWRFIARGEYLISNIGMIHMTNPNHIEEVDWYRVIGVERPL